MAENHRLCEALANLSFEPCMSVQNRFILLAKLWPLAMVPIFFSSFVIYNGGIVVGDRANHTPQLHLVQPLYFMAFSVAFLPQIFLHPSR